MDASAIIVTAGLAEIAAGSIAMGLGGYLAGKSDAEHYASERRREQQEVKEKPGAEVAEVAAIFQSYGLSAEESAPVVRGPHPVARRLGRLHDALRAGPREARPGTRAHGAPSPSPAPTSRADDPPRALPHPVERSRRPSASPSCVTLLALGVFGYVKGHFTGARPLRSSLQTVLIGSLAAAAAFLIARAIS